MKMIGITGPTGAGKTTALKVLADLGGEIIDCDAVYHDLLEQSIPMRQALVERFGDILGPEGKIDRKKLGTMVFGKGKDLTDLNAITHRFILDAVQHRVVQARAAHKIAVGIDAVALIESGMAETCDAVVGILAPPQLRVERIMAREGILEDYARLRVAAQQEDAFFRAHCTYIVENNRDDTPETFGAKARSLFQEILQA